MKLYIPYINKISSLVVALIMLLSLMSCVVAPVGDEVPGAVPKLTAADIDDDTQEEFDQALSYLKSDEYDKAIEVLQKLLEREKRFAAPYVNLGMAYLKKEDNKQAEEALHKALAIDLGHPVANNELGLLYRKLGRFDDAKKAYENALTVYPDYLPARKNLGILCEIYLRDLNCALEHFEQYQKYSPDDKTVNIWVTDLRRRVGR